MAVSQNGWSANDRSMIASYSLPGGQVALRMGDVSVILLWVANQFHSTVEPLVWPGVWGYAERTIRGSSTTLSNHASGTAIDLNAPAHWLGEVGTFTPAQMVAIRQILAVCEGVIRWGGDYSGRKDEMHFEINAGAEPVRRVADKIRAMNGVVPDPVPPPAPSPAPAPEEYDMDFIDLRNAHRDIVTGRHVDNLQGLLLAAGYGPSGLVGRNGLPDGKAGAKTREYLGHWQRRTNTGDGQGNADFMVGDGTWKSLIEF